MSRAVSINATVPALKTLCQDHALRISTIEPLLSGGSRVVMLDPRDADRVRVLMKGKLITGTIVRSPEHLSRQPPPSSRW